MNQEQADRISLQAGAVFQPRTPISTRDLFAGRWDQLTTIVDAVSQTGLHIVIHGERGVGKSSLANVIRPTVHVFDKKGFGGTRDAEDGKGDRLVIKVIANATDTFSSIWARALDEIFYDDDSPKMGFNPNRSGESVTLRQRFGIDDGELSVDDVRRILSELHDSVFVFDEFDRLTKTRAAPFTDLIKALSDFSAPSTVVLVGVSETVGELVKDHASIGRALIQIHLPRMKHDELAAILLKADEKLGVKFAGKASERIIQMSQGLPHYSHLAGLLSVREACKEYSLLVEPNHVDRAFEQATKQAHQTLITKYTNATRSAHKDALYTHVILACAITASTSPDGLGYFQPANILEPLSIILPQRSLEISTYNKHLAEFCDPKRDGVLERTGQSRAFRYRFKDPLFPSYIMMKGVAENLISSDRLAELLTRKSLG